LLLSIFACDIIVNGNKLSVQPLDILAISKIKKKVRYLPIFTAVVGNEKITISVELGRKIWLPLSDVGA